MTRYHLIVYGRVQAVGFRFFSQSLAAERGITGYAKNLHDGTVELEIQGAEEKLDQMIQLLKKGGGMIRVDHIALKRIAVREKETRFQITSE